MPTIHLTKRTIEAIPPLSVRTDPLFGSLPPPDEVAAEIVENLEAALEKFRSVASRLRFNGPTETSSKS